MRKPHGYATIIGDVSSNAVKLITDLNIRHTESEIDTYTCGHCNGIVHVPPQQDAADIGGLCKQCMDLICPRCVNKMTCTPWEKKMEKAEARQRLRDAV